MSLSIVAYFAINYKLYQIGEKLHAIVFNTLRPYFAQIFGRNDFKKLSFMFDISFSISFFLAFLLGSIIYFLSETFIYYWVGQEFYLGKVINVLFCVNFIIQASILPHRILLATSLYKTRNQNLIRLLDGVFKITISIIVISLYGIQGIVISSIISSFLVSHIFMNIFTSSLLNNKWYLKFLFITPIFILPSVIYIQSIPLSILLFVSVLIFQIFLNIKIISTDNFNLKSLKDFYLSLH